LIRAETRWGRHCVLITVVQINWGLVCAEHLNVISDHYVYIAKKSA